MKFQSNQEVRTYQVRNKLVYNSARKEIEEHNIRRESMKEETDVKRIIDGRVRAKFTL